MTAAAPSLRDIVESMPKCFQVPQWRIRQMCVRTTGIFAGLMKRELWLKQADSGSTDCERWVFVPLHEPEAYIVTCHELSHNYFESNMLARDLFVKEYTERLLLKYKRSGSPLVLQPLFPEKLKTVLHFLVNVFDDERCCALWGRIYPGDETMTRTRWRRLTRQMIAQGRAEREFFPYAFAVAEGVADEVKDPKPEFLAIRDVLEDAFREVRYADFQGCLIITRKTLDRIINVLLDDMDDPPASPSTGGMQMNKAQSLVASALDDADDAADGDSDDASDGQQGQPADDKQGGQAKPDPDQLDKDRASMLGYFCSSLAGAGDDDLGQDGTERYDDAKPLKRKAGRRQEIAKAWSIVNQSMDVDPMDSDDVQSYMDMGAQDMQRKIDAARDYVKCIEKDDWLSKESKCKVVFHDVDDSELGLPVQLTPQERAAAESMKVGFIRILGAQRADLDTAGDDLDIDAVIARKFDPTIVELFNVTDPASGFYSLLSCDASISMRGSPFEAVERAETMLRRGMDFPFVEIEKWAWTQLRDGQVDLFRIDPAASGSFADREGTWGYTPLHEAIRVSARQCMLTNKVRRCFVLTDGMPVYTGHGGSPFAAEQLVRFAAQNAAMARRNNVGLFGLVIGHAIDDKAMDLIFGGRRFWRRAPEVGDTAPALVDLVTEQFNHWLRTRH